MQKRKRILTILFLIVIILTVAFTWIVFMSASGDDIWHNKMDFALLLMLLVPVVFLETGFYQNCLYFFTEKDKKRWKTVFHVLMLITSVLLLISIGSLFFSMFYSLKWIEIIIISLFLLLVFLRILYSIFKNR